MEVCHPEQNEGPVQLPASASILHFVQDDGVSSIAFLKESAMIRTSIAAILLFIAIPLAQAQTATSSSVPAARLAHIRHGINLSGWFAQVYGPAGYSKEHLQNGETSADMALIKSAGFDQSK
jgi:hypothetical protein